MECVEAALKTSFRKELSFVKSSSFPQQSSSLLDDFLVQNGGSTCDDFSVDELLDFSNQEELFEIENEDDDDDDEEEEDDDDEKSPHQNNSSTSSNISPRKDDFDPVPPSELGVPADDLASLEWLSHFVEDSNSEYATPFPPGIHFPKEEDKARSGPVKPEPACSGTVFKTPVPARARSKRSRAGVRVWPLGTPSSESSSSSTSSSGSYSSPYQQTVGGWLLCPVEPLRRAKPGRKSKKAKQGEGEGSGGGAQHQVGGRRCSHCGVQKTPQWRAGPLGAKTLCNACGVRYKSGRLLPEYRPACSPTFSSELHSNSHRKVLEMRKKKEALGLGGPGQLEQPGSNDDVEVGSELPSF